MSGCGVERVGATDCCAGAVREKIVRLTSAASRCRRRKLTPTEAVEGCAASRQKRRRQARRDARSRALRKGKRIPKIGAAWQFRTGGSVLESYRGGTMYGRTMIAGVLLRWLRPVRDRPEAEALANAVVVARVDVRNAAIAWSDCPEPPEVKALLKQQGRLRDGRRLLRGSSATTVRSFPGRGPANTHRKSLARRAVKWWGLSRRCRDGLRLGVWWLREPR
jgi:hypothetical protein